LVSNLKEQLINKSLVKKSKIKGPHGKVLVTVEEFENADPKNKHDDLKRSKSTADLDQMGKRGSVS